MFSSYWKAHTLLDHGENIHIIVKTIEMRQETDPELASMEKYQWHWPGKSNLNWIVQIINSTIRILHLSSILFCTILITCHTSSACVHQSNHLLECFSANTDYYRQKEASPTTAHLCQRPHAKKPFSVTSCLLNVCHLRQVLSHIFPGIFRFWLGI